MAQLINGINLFKLDNAGDNGKIVFSTAAPNVDLTQDATTHWLQKGTDESAIFVYTNITLTVYQRNDAGEWSEYGVITPENGVFEGIDIPWVDGAEYMQFVASGVLDPKFILRLKSQTGPVIIDSTPGDIGTQADSLKDGDAVTLIPSV